MIPEQLSLLNDYASIQIIARMALYVPLADAEAVLREMERTESLMPLLDPTGWLAIRKTAPDHARLVRAFVAFRREIAALSEAAESEATP